MSLPQAYVIIVLVFMQDTELEKSSRVTAVNSSNRRSIVIAIVITALIAGTGGYLLGMRANQNASQGAQRASFYSSPTTNATKDKQAPKTGYEQRINGTLKYGYTYPIFSSFNAFPLRVEKLLPYDGISLLQPDPKAGLLKKDLYCGADGPHGSQRCQNTKVEDFTNPLGFKGFKVYRTKTHVYHIKPTAEEICGTCDDVVYVFPLQEKINDYDGVLFYLDNLTQPTQADISALEEVANSFFSF